jgi:UTP-glucose-1-phosphate uridylyltransferase
MHNKSEKNQEKIVHASITAGDKSVNIIFYNHSEALENLVKAQKELIEFLKAKVKRLENKLKQ